MGLLSRLLSWISSTAGALTSTTATSSAPPPSSEEKKTSFHSRLIPCFSSTSIVPDSSSSISLFSTTTTSSLPSSTTAISSAPSCKTATKFPQSKSTVIGTIYVHRGGRVYFYIQNDRLSSKPYLLVELTMSFQLLAEEMQCGVLRMDFKCDRPDMNIRKLKSIPLWSHYCNGRKVGHAVRRHATDKDHRILKNLKLESSGIGVIPSDSKVYGAVKYVRMNLERVVESSNLESFHLLSQVESSKDEENLNIFFSTVSS